MGVITGTLMLDPPAAGNISCGGGTGAGAGPSCTAPLMPGMLEVLGDTDAVDPTVLGKSIRNVIYNAWL